MSATPLTATSAASRPVRPLSGGTFTATYKGKIETHYQSSQSQIINFVGKGNATFLGKSKEDLTIECFYQTSRGTICEGFTDVLKGKHKNALSMVWDESSAPYYPCGSTYAWTAYGGSGKFARATGGGSVTLSCSGNKYSTSWSGTLNY